MPHDADISERRGGGFGSFGGVPVWRCIDMGGCGRGLALIQKGTCTFGNYCLGPLHRKSKGILGVSWTSVAGVVGRL